MITEAQMATVKAYILATPALAALTSGPGTDYNTIALTLSADANPAFRVWKTSLTRNDAMGDGFDFTQVDNLTTGQARIWEWLFIDGPMNPSVTSRRTAVSEAWKGTAAKVAVATYVLGQCKRNASQVEKLLATGTGSDAAPATMTHEGGISLSEVASMFNV